MAESAPDRPTLALIVNDQEWCSRSLETVLAPGGYAFLRAYNGRQAIELARETMPDVIILDSDLPGMSGIEVCRILRREPRISSNTPILITTSGELTREARIEALKAGAWDVRGWPIDADEVMLRLSLYVKAKFDADRIRDESLMDPVTGLYNLRGLMRRARELGSDAFRSGRALACVAFAPHISADADSGNCEPDRAVWAAVNRVGEVFRSRGRVSDAIGRIRLGEFVVIAPATNEAGALNLAKRLQKAVEAAALGAGVAPPSLLAGYDAVDNFQSAGIQPAALMAGATTALRRLQADPGDDTILHYDGQRDSTTSEP